MMSREYFEIDEVDRTIIDLLRDNAELTSHEIAKIVKLSSSAVHERVRKLQANGVIIKIASLISAVAIDKTMCAFISVEVDNSINTKDFVKKITKLDSVLECHFLTGEYSLLLKARFQDTTELEEFISDTVRSQKGVVRVLTRVVLASYKDESTIVDVPF